MAGPLGVESLNSLLTRSLLPETLRINFFLLFNKDKTPDSKPSLSLLTLLPFCLDVLFWKLTSQGTEGPRHPKHATHAHTHLADMPLAHLQRAQSILLL